MNINVVLSIHDHFRDPATGFRRCKYQFQFTGGFATIGCDSKAGSDRRNIQILRGQEEPIKFVCGLAYRQEFKNPAATVTNYHDIQVRLVGRSGQGANIVLECQVANQQPDLSGAVLSGYARGRGDQPVYAIHAPVYQALAVRGQF